MIRVRGGDLKYSDAERKALMRAGVLGKVVAETGTATSTSNEVEVTLLPAGNRAGKDGGAGAGGSHDGARPRRADLAKAGAEPGSSWSIPARPASTF